MGDRNNNEQEMSSPGGNNNDDSEQQNRREEEAEPEHKKEKAEIHHDIKKAEEEDDPMKNPDVKPFENDFMQQRLKHFYPQHEPRTVVLCLFLTAIVFLPIGAAVLVASDSVFEYEVPYSGTNKCRYNNHQSAVTITHTMGTNTYTETMGCTTRATFTLGKTIAQPVYIYYRIKGLYQSWRLFGESKSERQWRGDKDLSRGDLSDCEPFRGPGDRKGSGATRLVVDSQNKTYNDFTYYPCGAVPHALFNDTIRLYQVVSTASVPTTGSMPASATLICDGGAFLADGTSTNNANRCEKKGIALKVDRDSRFQGTGSTSSVWTGRGYNNTDDVFFYNGYYDGELGHRVPDGSDEDFMVWARLAGIADFRKLYRKINQDLVAGDYALDITELYDTDSFGGEKFVVIATTSWVGGKNPVLAILYLVLGSLSFVLAFAFLIAWLCKNKEGGNEEAA